MKTNFSLDPYKNKIPSLSSYQDLPILKLNYTNRAKFAFDNTTNKELQGIIGKIFEKAWGKGYSFGSKSYNVFPPEKPKNETSN